MDRLKSQPDLLSVPNKNCPHVSNDHPPVCQQVAGFSCRKCPEHLDGITNIPLEKHLKTANMRALQLIMKSMDKEYGEVDEHYHKIHMLAEAKQVALRRVREEQGR